VGTVTTLPIDNAALPDVGRFLSEHVNSRIAPNAWVDSLVHPWSESRPNFGFQLRDGGALKGVFCAIYSDQSIDNRIERFCNPHSWCVLSDYRKHSLGLALALIKQPGYHFTMLTPNPNVAEIFLRLGFKGLDDRVAVLPNSPSALATVGSHVAEFARDRIASHLSGSVLRDFELHREIPWLRFLAFGRGSDICLIVYKVGRWKRMPCARIMHVSDSAAFDRHLHLMKHSLLLRQRLLVSRVEARFLGRDPRVAYWDRRRQAKLVKSSSLRDSQVSDLYSELASLDL